MREGLDLAAVEFRSGVGLTRGEPDTGPWIEWSEQDRNSLLELAFLDRVDFAKVGSLDLFFEEPLSRFGNWQLRFRKDETRFQLNGEASSTGLRFLFPDDLAIQAEELVVVASEVAAGRLVRAELTPRGSLLAELLGKQAEIGDGSLLVEVGGENRDGVLLRAGLEATTNLEPVREAEVQEVLSFSMTTALLSPGPAMVDVWAGKHLLTSFDLNPSANRPVGGASNWQQVRLPLEGEGLDEAFELRFVVDGVGLVGISEVRRFLPSQEPRTVLLVTSDTHRADHLDLSEGDDNFTPGLRELARQGVVFTDVLSSSNITGPSHTAVMTGLLPKQTGVLDNRTSLADQANTLAEAFSRQGYQTWAAVSVNLLSPRSIGLGQGFDRVMAPTKRFDGDEAIKVARRWLDASPERDVFLWVHVFTAHGPYQPPQEDIFKHWSRERNPFDPSLPDPAERGVRIPSWIPGLRDEEYLRASYAAEVTYLDRNLQSLLELERVSKGIVGFTADHGESLGQHDHWWSHRGVHMDTLRVPLIVKGPGAPAGERRAVPVSQWNIGRTLLDLAGHREEAFPGLNLLDQSILGSDERRPRFAIEGSRRWASIVFEDWQLIRQASGYGSGGIPSLKLDEPAELYDLKRDPAGGNNLVDGHASRVQELTGYLERWILEEPDSSLVGFRRTDKATLRNLAELGYVDGDEAESPDSED